MFFLWHVFSFKLGDALFKSLYPVPEHEDKIRNRFGISLGQGDEFFASRSSQGKSTAPRWLSFLNYLNCYLAVAGAKSPIDTSVC